MWKDGVWSHDQVHLTGIMLRGERMRKRGPGCRHVGERGAEELREREREETGGDLLE